MIKTTKNGISYIHVCESQIKQKLVNLFAATLLLQMCVRGEKEQLHSEQLHCLDTKREQPPVFFHLQELKRVVDACMLSLLKRGMELNVIYGCFHLSFALFPEIFWCGPCKCSLICVRVCVLKVNILFVLVQVMASFVPNLTV